MTDEFEAYCFVDGCGERATVERPWGLTEDGDEIVELVCPAHGDTDG